MPDRNLAEVLRRQAEALGPKVAVRFKRDGRYQDLTWQQYRDDALACAAALVLQGIEPGDRVGLLGENRVEWLVADMGILTAGAVAVTPHSSLSARQVAYQMRDAGARWLFVSTAAQLEKVRQVRAELPDLKGVVVFDSAAAGGDATTWEAFLKQGREALPRLAAELARRETAVGWDDLATIMYTSGTTGNPKGVMLTHGNLLSNVRGVPGSPVRATRRRDTVLAAAQPHLRAHGRSLRAPARRAWCCAWRKAPRRWSRTSRRSSRRTSPACRASTRRCWRRSRHRTPR